ncbi:MAG: translation initiation factor IF-2 N-terminal domain-containing protein [Flavobacteriales bacterium]
MAEQSQRLSKVAKEFNVGVDTILEFLASKGVDDLNRNSKISPETYEVLVDEYQPDKKVKAEAKELKKAEAEQKSQEKEEVQTLRVSVPKMEGLKIVSKVDITEAKSTPEQEEVKTEVDEPSTQKPEAPVDENPSDSQESDEKVVEKTDEQSKKPEESSQDNIFTPALEEKTTEGASVIRAKAKKLDGPTIVSSEKIDLSKFKKPEKKPVASSSAKIEG